MEVRTCLLFFELWVCERAPGSGRCPRVSCVEGVGFAPSPLALHSSWISPQYLHGRGTIHRDIKPENIMLSFNGLARLPHGVPMSATQLRVKLVDFGLAKMLGVDHSVAKSMTGTPQYIAPEVLTAQTRAAYSFPVRWFFARVAPTPPPRHCAEARPLRIVFLFNFRHMVLCDCVPSRWTAGAWASCCT